MHVIQIVRVGVVVGGVENGAVPNFGGVHYEGLVVKKTNIFSEL